METTNPYHAPQQASTASSDGVAEPVLVDRRWIVTGAFICAIPSAIWGACTNWFFQDPRWAEIPEYYTPPTTAELVFSCMYFAALFGIPGGVFGAILGAVFYRLRSLLREIMS